MYTITINYSEYRIIHLLLLQIRRPTIVSQMMLIHTPNIIDCTQTKCSLTHIPHSRHSPACTARSYRPIDSTCFKIFRSGSSMPLSLLQYSLSRGGALQYASPSNFPPSFFLISAKERTSTEVVAVRPQVFVAQPPHGLSLGVPLWRPENPPNEVVENPLSCIQVNASVPTKTRRCLLSVHK